MFTLLDSYFVTANGSTTLGGVADKLRSAIETAGYQSHRFMPAQGGFALITEFEKISAAGKPDPHQRFNVNLQTNSARFFSLSDYLKALLTADVGHYRISVFIVTSGVVEQAAQGTTASALENLRGTDVLPPEVRGQPYVPANGSHCTVLVYEFEKPQNGDASLLTPSPVGGRDQLATAGILDQLSR